MSIVHGYTVCDRLNMMLLLGYTLYCFVVMFGDSLQKISLNSDVEM